MRKLILAGLLCLLPLAVSAQELGFSPSVGGGSLFAEEDETFDTSNFFASLQIELVGVSFLDIDSGVSAEAGYSGGQITYSVWNLNRAPVGKGMYAGSDFKILSNYGEGTKGDFDVRAVVGYNASDNVSFEVYSLEEDRPISFAFLYRF
jgi:hypothetical protein